MVFSSSSSSSSSSRAVTTANGVVKQGKAGKRLREDIGSDDTGAIKKKKNIIQVKAVSVEKRAGISLKIAEGQKRKQEPPRPPLSFSPTALVLKFSPGTSLPSVAKLKASFIMFGPLVKDSTRIYWESNSCRVIFKHKPHAEAALNGATKNDLLLGPCRCRIRELDPSTLKPLSNIPGKLQPPQSRPGGGPQLGPGNGVQPRALPYQQQRAPRGPLKSILKKPRAVEKQHLLPPPPFPPSISLPPPAPAADDPLPSISLPTPPPPPPPPPLPRIVDGFEASGLGPAQFNQSRPQNNGQHAVGEGRNGVDISNQMLILLRRCSDIVANVKSSLGYLPYHPL